MKNKNLIFLIIGLAISSGTLLTERFITSLSDGTVTALMILAIASLIIYLLKYRSGLKQPVK